MFCKVILDAEPWRSDVTLTPLPWRSFNGVWSGGEGRLRVGIMRNNGVVRPTAPVRRALDCMQVKLKGCSEIKVVEIAQPDFAAGIWDLTVSILRDEAKCQRALYFIDGARKIKDTLGDEPILPLTAWIIKDALQRTSSRRSQR